MKRLLAIIMIAGAFTPPVSAALISRSMEFLRTPDYGLTCWTPGRKSFLSLAIQPGERLVTVNSTNGSNRYPVLDYDFSDRNHVGTIQFTDRHSHVRAIVEMDDGTWLYFPRDDEQKWVYSCFKRLQAKPKRVT